MTVCFLWRQAARAAEPTRPRRLLVEQFNWIMEERVEESRACYLLRL